jgi:hypothetical protein
MTMADERKMEDAEALDAAFDALRVATPDPSDDLLARIAAEGEALRPTPPKRRQRGAFSGLFDQIGGWPSLAGFAAASAAGLYIGIAAPDLLSLPQFGEATEYDLGDLMPGYGLMLGEEG